MALWQKHNIYFQWDPLRLCHRYWATQLLFAAASWQSDTNSNAANYATQRPVKFQCCKRCNRVINLSLLLSNGQMTIIGQRRKLVTIKFNTTDYLAKTKHTYILYIIIFYWRWTTPITPANFRPGKILVIICFIITHIIKIRKISLWVPW